MNDYIKNFNKELIKLLKYLNSFIDKDDTSKLIEELKNNLDTDKYINNFWENINSKSKMISQHDEFLFCKDIDIINNLSLFEYYNHENITEENKNKLWEYLEFMYLYTYSYKTNIDLLKEKINNIENELENKDNNENLQSWLAIVDNIKNNKRRTEESKNMKDDDNNNEFKMPNIPNMPNMPKIDKDTFKKFEEYSEQLTNGPIGKLAKDIAENLDLDDISNPNDILTSLCKGDMKDNKLMSLMSKVGGELQNKMNNSDINQDDLMKDASSIMNNFSGFFNQNGINEDMFKNFQNPTNQKNTKTTLDKNNIKKQKTRERLLKKLEEKKKNNNI